jgi:hypothetical protein
MSERGARVPLVSEVLDTDVISKPFDTIHARMLDKVRVTSAAGENYSKCTVCEKEISGDME